MILPRGHRLATRPAISLWSALASDGSGRAPVPPGSASSSTPAVQRLQFQHRLTTDDYLGVQAMVAGFSESPWSQPRRTTIAAVGVAPHPGRQVERRIWAVRMSRLPDSPVVEDLVTALRRSASSEPHRSRPSRPQRHISAVAGHAVRADARSPTGSYRRSTQSRSTSLIRAACLCRLSWPPRYLEPGGQQDRRLRSLDELEQLRLSTEVTPRRRISMMNNAALPSVWARCSEGTPDFDAHGTSPARSRSTISASHHLLVTCPVRISRLPRRSSRGGG